MASPIFVTPERGASRHTEPVGVHRERDVRAPAPHTPRAGLVGQTPATLCRLDLTGGQARCKLKSQYSPWRPVTHVQGQHIIGFLFRTGIIVPVLSRIQEEEILWED